MQRITVTLDDELVASLDALVATSGYGNRSEAVRDLARAGLLQREAPDGDGECVAALVYVYDHEARQLPRRLTDRFHDHHALAVSTLHVHLDRRECMELAVLRGPGAQVRALGEHVIAERGVRHGRLLVIPATEQATAAGEKHRPRHAQAAAVVAEPAGDAAGA